jgi:hypothetical protein
MTMSFKKTWSYIQSNLHAGQLIDNWTKDGRYYIKQLSIVRVRPGKVILIKSPNAKDVQRIPQDDFKKVYDVWSQYKASTFPRRRIRDDLTRFSTYIISVLHWVEQNNNGTLP